LNGQNFPFTGNFGLFFFSILKFGFKRYNFCHGYPPVRFDGSPSILQRWASSTTDNISPAIKPVNFGINPYPSGKGLPDWVGGSSEGFHSWASGFAAKGPVKSPECGFAGVFKRALSYGQETWYPKNFGFHCYFGNDFI
jgi:hypothetical protein